MTKTFFLAAIFAAFGVSAAEMRAKSTENELAHERSGTSLHQVVSNGAELCLALSEFRRECRDHSTMEILLESGTYEIPDGLDFTGMSSESRLVLKAMERHGARLVGGYTIPCARFKSVAMDAKEDRIPLPARRFVVVADVRDILPGVLSEFPDSFVGRYPAPVLFVNGQLATLARWPDVGWATFSVSVERGEKVPGSRDMYSGGAFVFPDASEHNWRFDEGVWLNGYWTHDWYNNSIRAVSFGENRGTNQVMRLRGKYFAGVIGEKTWGLAARRFYVFNVLDELDAPGEWWLDRKLKRLYIYPPKGRFTDQDVVVLATSPKPMIRGCDSRHIIFEELSFSCNYGDIVSFKRSANICLTDCSIAGTAGSGIVVDGFSNRVSSCEISSCGGQGVVLSGGIRRTLRRSDSMVEKCRIHDFGMLQRTYAPGCTVGGVGMIVRANEIFNAPHSAVIYDGNEHLFEANDVHHVLLETGDSGAFYTGRDWTSQGNVLKGNYIHELGGDTRASSTMGIYFDDCDCGDDVIGNVIWKVSRGVMIGGGREHLVWGNVFADCGVGVSIDCRGLTWKEWNSREHGGPSWLFEEKAEAVGYLDEVWRSRYPRLARIMVDSPREPLYNSIVSNDFVDCRWKAIYLEGEKMREYADKIQFCGNRIVATLSSNVATSVEDEIQYGFTRTNRVDFGRFNLSQLGCRAIGEIEDARR